MTSLENRGVASTATARQRELEDFLDYLSSTVAHELRTPLAVIAGYAELLRTRDNDETRREAPRRIQEAAERLLGLIDDIVTASAIESGAVVLDREPVEVEAAVASAIRLVEPTSDRHSFGAQCVNQAGWPVVSADPEQLARMLVTLVSNAVMSSPQGGEVFVTARREGRVALVSVADEGPGMAEAERAHVFERVSRVGLPGRGDAAARLGLSVTRGLVELHGGSIWVESEPGKGSTFRFTLPLHEGGGAE